MGAVGSLKGWGYLLYYATNFVFTGSPWPSPSMPAFSISVAKARPIWRASAPPPLASL